MRRVVAQLHLQFVKVKYVTGLCNINVFEIYDVPESCEKLEINGEPYIRAPTLFDPGSDGVAHNQALEENVDLYALKKKLSAYKV